MARAQKDKLYRSFNKGLVTEAGFLTYPEDASTDELNTVLYRKGNRSRRLGMDYEEDSPGFTADNLSPTSTVTEYFWRAPGNKSALNFVVLQVDYFLYFFDASSEPLAAGKKAFTVDLREFKAPAASIDQIRGVHVAITAGKGYLFVAHEYIDPFNVEYDPETDSIRTVRIYIMMRDYDGVDDNLANDAEPSNLSNEHLYNLRNQGWVAPGSPSVQGSVPGVAGTDGTGNTATPGEGLETGGSSGGYVDPYDGEWHYSSPYTREEV